MPDTVIEQFKIALNSSIQIAETATLEIKKDAIQYMLNQAFHFANLHAFEDEYARILRQSITDYNTDIAIPEFCFCDRRLEDDASARRTTPCQSPESTIGQESGNSQGKPPINYCYLFLITFYQ